MKQLALILALVSTSASILHAADEVAVRRSITRSLEYLAREQRRQGFWEANGGQYRVAMTALAGTALLAEGSTMTRGKYSKNITDAVNFLVDMSQPTGLIGFPDDYHYTYGHGFSMLFLSQVYGEEEDAQRRARIKRVLDKAVRFSAEAQTDKGGWGYVSAREGNNFDEGSTCVTQVQGLRACRNAGIVVPREIIDHAKGYIRECMTEDGGIEYSIRGGGARAPITAAAVASMYSAGEYAETDDVEKMLNYCKTNIWPEGNGIKNNSFGHWHYMHYYLAQVMYREEELWDKYRDEIEAVLISRQGPDGSWQDSSVGPVYVTAMNATLLQLKNGYLPIFQR